LGQVDVFLLLYATADGDDDFGLVRSTACLASLNQSSGCSDAASKVTAKDSTDAGAAADSALSPRKAPFWNVAIQGRVNQNQRQLKFSLEHLAREEQLAALCL